MSHLIRRLALPALAGAAALVPWSSQSIERIYSGGIYPHIQPTLTRASNAVPFAWLDVWIVLALASIVGTAARARRGGAGWIAALGATLWRAVTVASTAYLLFLLLWGLNYRRTEADARFAVAQTRLDPARVRAVAVRAAQELNRLHDRHRRHPELAADSLVVMMTLPFAQTERDLGAPWRAVPGRPKGSAVAATFRWIAVDGLTNPLGLEVVLNPDLLPFERPFVLAHEWAHLAGHAGEGEASFVGWLTCLHGSPAAQYSGWLGLLVHVVRALPAPDAQSVLKSLGAGPAADWEAMVERYQRSNALVRHASWRIYDRYLRANRVDAGIESYDDVVRLVAAAPVARQFLP
jgi:hypothetical protein